ncbi:MAG: PPOX class F420-dependent oxidoreductase [Archaeoglobus sp.]|jgi:PPOX class probable F420-dependent enzyme|nr:PPOX class F420-dependent oxidoreductase [Archaeoglobus sp.]
MGIPEQLKKAKFICIETYKKNGEAVRTPVWFAIEGDLIYFHTPKNSGKVKRLRRNPRVRVAPCSRFGKIEGDWFEGVATELAEGDVERVIKLVNSRLGFLDRIISLFHRKNRLAFSIKLLGS